MNYFYILVSLALSFSSLAETKTYNIWAQNKAPVNFEQTETKEVKVTVYTPKNNSGKAIVICPGGGYRVHAINPEGHGIAKWLNKHGITGIVLEYRFPKGRKLVPLFDANRAIRFVRHNAQKLGINKNQIGILGFSAGGHLASSALVHQLACPVQDDISSQNARPDFGVLIYPVITMGQHTHSGSKFNLLGKNPSEKDLRFFSTELQVNSFTPPVFLAHALDDKPVPPMNSKLFYERLKKKGGSAKYLELPNGGHGLSGYKGPSWDAWQKESLKWINNILK